MKYFFILDPEMLEKIGHGWSCVKISEVFGRFLVIVDVDYFIAKNSYHFERSES